MQLLLALRVVRDLPVIWSLAIDTKRSLAARKFSQARRQIGPAACRQLIGNGLYRGPYYDCTLTNGRAPHYVSCMLRSLKVFISSTNNVAALRACTELAGVHVLDHASAQRADGIRTHKETPVLDEVDDTSILKTGHPARYR